LFKVDQPDDLVKSAAESVVREVIGKNELDAIITTGRQELRGVVTAQLQTLLDEYEAGVADKIILDSGAGSGVVPYLPLDKLNRPGGAN